MTPIQRLAEFGQSPWLDNLTRDMVRSGELKELMDEGIRGVTSNPATFSKAIAGSDQYDKQIQRLAEDGTAVFTIFEHLAVDDVRDACDVLRPLYNQTGDDGMVSLEVSAYLAHDTQATLTEARRLWQAVGRPNLFIKIPGTKAGVPAVEQALYEGINVNITLLFGVPDYEAVANAYVNALDRRLNEGKSVDDMVSVASFFLSRIDVLVDGLLGHRIAGSPEGGDGAAPQRLIGQVAIASAKQAYQSYLRIFSGPKWDRLARAGAKVQRPLWASTSTKDPVYSDVRYVEPLIGADTVNTMPEDTIDAFADHGEVADTIADGADDAAETLAALETVGIDLEDVVRRLIDEGVGKFIAPYDKLMGLLAHKRLDALADTCTTQETHAGPWGDDFDEILDALNTRQFGTRLYHGDPLLWTADPAARPALAAWAGQQFAFAVDEDSWRTVTDEGQFESTDFATAERSAKVVRTDCGPYVPAAANPAVQLATLLMLACRNDGGGVLLKVSDSLVNLGKWIQQQARDLTGDRLSVALSGDEDSFDMVVVVQMAGDRTGVSGDKPRVVVTLPDASAIGGEVVRWQLALSAATALLQSAPQSVLEIAGAA